MFNIATLTCHVCNYTSTTKANFRNHIYSMRHHKNAEKARTQSISVESDRLDRRDTRGEEECTTYLVDYKQPSSTEIDNTQFMPKNDVHEHIHTLVRHNSPPDDVYDEIAYAYTYAYTCTQLSAACTSICLGAAILLYAYIR